MKARKLLSVLMSLSLVLGLLGVASAEAVYTKTVNGMMGAMTVELTVENDKIASVKVTDHVETPGIGGYAAEVVPQRITESQSLAVDVVSGATVTSRIVLAAVTDLIKEAGLDPEQFKAESKAEEVESELTADVVIVGGGGAGLAAAVSATGQGASVILIEKMGFLGGNSIVAGGIYNAPDHELQDKAEVPGNVHSLVEAAIAEEPVSEAHKRLIEAVKADYEEFKQSGHTLFDSANWFALQTWNGGDKIADIEIVKTMADQSKTGLDWLRDMGLEYYDSITQGAGSLYPRTHRAVKPNGTGYIDAFTSRLAEAKNYRVLMNTEGKSLITENGRVAGVKAQTKDGQEIVLRATKGVILATGGFAGNVQLRQEYCEGEKWPDLGAKLPTSNVRGVTGDGIFMARDVGANLVNMDQIQLLHVCNPKTGATYDIIAGTTVGGIFVNREGKRFVAEDGRRDVISKAIIAQTDSVMNIVFSADIAPDPATAMALGGQSLQFYLDHNPDYVTAPTLDELAVKMGVPADELKKTVEEYNKAFDAGVADEFGRVNYSKKIETAPFYAYLRSPAAHHTMGGVQIDTSARVLNAEGQPIEGLYAAGEITGVVHGGNRLGGNALVDFTVFGRIAGESVVKDNP